MESVALEEFALLGVADTISPRADGVRALQEVLCRVEAVMQVCEVSAGSTLTTRPPRCCVLQESLLTKLFHPWNDTQGRAHFLTGLTTAARVRDSR